MTDYSSERGDPGGAQCGQNSLLFDAYYLKLLVGGSVIRAWHARSGKKDSSGLFNYSSAQQKLSNVGPIPEGDYWIQPAQLTSVWFGGDAWGKHRITIHVRPKTVSYGRGGFFIHGGAVWGSAGCIDLTYGMEAFATFLDSADDGSCYIPLTVNYNGTGTIAAPA